MLSEPLGPLAMAGTRVVLVGAATYETGSILPSVTAVAATVGDLGRTLVQRCGVPEANLSVVLDPRTPQSLGEALLAAAAQATDALVIFYVGHGLVGPPWRCSESSDSTSRPASKSLGAASGFHKDGRHGYDPKS